MTTKSGKAARSVHPLLRAYAGELNARMGRGFKTRLWGLAVCGGAGGLVAVGGGVPLPQPAAFALGLTSFALACLGILFLIHGAGLRDRWRVGILGKGQPAHSATNFAQPGNCSVDRQDLRAWRLEGRPNIATHLILRALHDAAHEASHDAIRRPGRTRRS